MMRDKLVGVFKEAAEINLRYSAVVLRLAREYVKEFDGVLRGTEASEKPETDGNPPQNNEQRSPLLLAAAAGKEATAAFVLNNTSAAELPVKLVVEAEMAAATPEIEPTAFTIPGNQSAVAQLKLRIDPRLDLGRDYRGVVLAPSLSAEPIDFVVRRLAASKRPPTSQKRKAPTRAAR